MTAERSCADELTDALSGIPLVREVRGHGYLLGVSFVDPRDGESFLPPELRVGGRIDAAAFDRGLIVLSTQPTRDGYAGDQTLFAPAFTATDEELGEMVSRFADVVHQVAEEVEPDLIGRRARHRRHPEERDDDDALRALILQHEEPTPPGHVTDWLANHDATVETSCGSTSTTAKSTPRSYDLIVSLGSEFAAFDDTKPFVPREATLMRKAIDADVPVLGLCFGGQMLARVLGGRGVPRRTCGDRLAAGAEHGSRSWCPTVRGSSGTSTPSPCRRARP